MGRDEDGLVYSTGIGRMCPGCGRAAAACACKKGKPKAAGGGKGPSLPPAGKGITVGRATQGRKGKGVTVVTGLGLDEAGLADLARRLKAVCGAGGTVREGAIEIQGEHRDSVIAELERMGIKAKRSGG